MFTVLTGVLCWLLYGWLYFSSNEPSAAIVCFSGSALFIVGLLSYGVFRHYAIHWYYWFAVMTLGISFVHYFLGGFALSAMVLLWALVVPVETLVTYKPRHGLDDVFRRRHHLYFFCNSTTLQSTSHKQFPTVSGYVIIRIEYSGGYVLYGSRRVLFCMAE